MSAYDRLARQIGTALRRIRIERGARQYAVADLAGITKALLSAYEQGREHPSLATVAKVLGALDCSVEEFGRYFGPWASLPD